LEETRAALPGLHDRAERRLQRDALTWAGCWKVFTDHETGTGNDARS
jgi:hypothetical protein